MTFKIWTLYLSLKLQASTKTVGIQDEILLNFYEKTKATDIEIVSVFRLNLYLVYLVIC